MEDANGGIDSESLSIDGFTTAEIGYHCELMNESGLINTIDTQTMGDVFPTFFIKRLTSKGHDFTDSARSDTLWQKAMTTISATAGGVTIDVMIRYLKQQAYSALGMQQEP